MTLDYDAQTLVPTVTKTAAYTAAVNDLVIVDGTSSSVPATLPAAPGDMSTVGVHRHDATYTSANTPTITPGGSDAFLGGNTTPLQLLLQGQYYIFQYSSSRAQWIPISTGVSLSQLDTRYLNQNTTGNAATATKLVAARTLDGQAFDGTANVTIIAPGTHAATSKTPPAGADEFPIADSAASYGLKKLTWANLETALDSRYEPLEAFTTLSAAYTLASQTAAQQIFNTTTLGAITLPAGDYFFECVFELSNLSATSGNWGFGFGGTATFTQSWLAVATKTTATTGGTATLAWCTANTAGVSSTNTGTLGYGLIKGRINITTAGTLIPQVSMTQASAAVVAAGAFFRIQSVDSTALYAGSWT